jgi:glycosyltransferase involved in cell wall biosynthesis
MRATVAICTWNRARLLDQTLAGLRQLRPAAGLAWDVVVVNNNCTDDTDAVLERHAKALPLRRVFEPVPGISAARNRALAEATGDWIVWTDDDVLVDPGWLAEFAAATRRHPAAAVVGGRVEPWFEVPPDPALAEAFEVVRIGFAGTDHGPDERPLGPPAEVYTVNMACRRSAIAGLTFDPRRGSVHGFQNKGEDLAFLRDVRARGGEVVWAPAMRVRHYVDPGRVTVDYLRRYYRDCGRGAMFTEGVPAGSRVFGMPRWLIRKYLGHQVGYLARRLRGDRTGALGHLRECWLRGGMLRACYDLYRGRAEVAPAAAREAAP